MSPTHVSMEANAKLFLLFTANKHPRLIDVSVHGGTGVVTVKVSSHSRGTCAVACGILPIILHVHMRLPLGFLCNS